MAGVARSFFDAVKTRLEPQFPELGVGDPKSVFEVDRARREIGASPTTLGSATENAFITSWPSPDEVMGAGRGDASSYPSPDETAGASRGAFFGGDNPFLTMQAHQSEDVFARNRAAPPSVGALEGTGHILSFLGGTLGRDLLPEGFPRWLKIATEEALRPANYLGAGIRGLSFAPKATAGARAVIEPLAAIGGRLAGEKVADVTGSESAGAIAQLAGNVGSGLAAAKVLSPSSVRSIATQGFGGDTTAVQKLIERVNEAKPLLKSQQALRTAELGARSGRVSGQFASQSGEQAFQAAKGELKGALPRTAFESPRPDFSQQEIDALFDQVRTHPQLRPFDRINAGDALTTALSGEVPARGEIALLEKIFGSDLAHALAGKRSSGQKVRELAGELLNAPRTLQASIDASAPFRQGVILSVAHPTAAAKATWGMIKAFGSEKSAEYIDDAIRSRPWAAEAERAGIYRSPLFGDFSKLADREEAFIGNIVERIPGIGKAVRASERGYVTYLNKLRDDVFGSITQGWDEAARTDENLQRLGRFINTATGRGDLGWLNEHAPTLNAAFFAPRFVASRIQVNAEGLKAAASLGRSAVRGQAFDPVSKQVAGDLAKFYGSGIAALGLLKASGAADVELNPRSSDFGKVRIGPVRYDFWGGNQQIARFVANLISGEKKSPTTGTIYPVDRPQVVVDFLRSKLSPIAGLATDVATGRTITGDQVDLTNSTNLSQQTWNRLAPFFVHDLVEATYKDGLVGGIQTIPSAVGIGYQRFGEERVPLDQKAQELYGATYNALPRSQQREVEAALPDVAQKIAQDSIARGGVAGARAQVRVDTAKQLAEIDPQLQGKALRDRIGAIEDEARVRREQITRMEGGSVPAPRTPDESALNQYYAAMVKMPDGSIDWDATDAARAGLEKTWTDAQKAYIEQETGATDPNLPPRIRELKQVRNQLEDTGFYELADKTWADVSRQSMLKKAIGGEFKDYYAWREVTRRSVEQQLIRAGIPEGSAGAMAAREVDKHPVAKAFSELKNIRETQFIHAHVADGLADKAIKWGYINPTNKEIGAIASFPGQVVPLPAR